MKIIDSVWEKENLGITSKEVIVEENDKPADVEKALLQLKEQYIVVKVPAGMCEVMNKVQDIGYRFAEGIIALEHDLHEIERNRIYQRLYDSVEYRRMTEKDIEELYAEIDGGMFSSDRISLDPKFSKELSARRYKNWVRNMLADGALPYAMVYKGEPAGFIILTTKDQKSYYSVLGGGYAKFRRSGLGIVQKEQEIVKALGGHSVMTKVSSNNCNQLKALLANGYVISQIDYVFTKHNG